MSPWPEPERVARAALTAVVEPGTVALARQLLDDGALPVLERLRSGRGSRELDPDGRLQRLLRGVDGAQLLERGAEAEARFLCPGDPGWPAAFDDLVLSMDLGQRPVPPPVGLWVRGPADPDALLPRSVAVVGARAATEYGTRVASELGADLVSAGWTVVSGAAYGIDAAAHRGALAVGGPTVAVLACGVDIPYPRTHGALLDRIADEGLVLSELPPGATPRRAAFLKRNRLIAAMTRGVVVVEAALRSGALNTAGWAGDLGRDVLAVPGPVTSALSAGCHKLVRDGAAQLVTSAAEIIDLLGELVVDAAPEPRGPDRPLDHLEPAARDVYEAMPARDAVTVDRICRDTGFSVPACTAALGELASAGLAERDPDGGWRVIRPRTPRAGA